MKISVIVPVYNVAPYLAICLNSLLPALAPGDELLLVQGASTDKSKEISLQYKAEHTQVMVLEQNGTGLSNARNCGLQAATGDYVLFIDSDDFVETGTLSQLLSSIRKNGTSVDVWMTDYYKHFEANETDQLVEQIGSQHVSQVQELAKILPSHQCFWNVWKNVYRRSFLLENMLFFTENTYAEDIDFMTRLYLAGPKIRTAPLPFYYYRIGRSGSLMNGVPLKRVQDTVSVLENSIQRLRYSGFAWIGPVVSGFQFEYLLNLALLCEVSTPHQREAQKAYRDYRKILRPTTDFAVMACTAAMYLIGVKGMSRLLWFAKYMKRKKEHRTI